MQGMSGLFQADFGRGFEAWHELESWCSQSGNRGIASWSLLGQADNLTRQGEFAEANVLYQRAGDVLGGDATSTEEFWMRGMHSLVLLRLGSVEPALREAQRALQVHGAWPVAYWTQHGTAAICEMLLEIASDPDQAPHSRAEAERLLPGATALLGRFAALFPLGRAASDLHAGRLARRRGWDAASGAQVASCGEPRIAARHALRGCSGAAGAVRIPGIAFRIGAA